MSIVLLSLELKNNVETPTESKLIDRFGEEAIENSSIVIKDEGLHWVRQKMRVERPVNFEGIIILLRISDA